MECRVRDGRGGGGLEKVEFHWTGIEAAGYNGISGHLQLPRKSTDSRSCLQCLLSVHADEQKTSQAVNGTQSARSAAALFDA